jgi:hypothetical protein
MSAANDLNASVIAQGNARGGILWRNNTGRRGNVSFGKVGSGDVIGCYHGYFVSIETKTENDRPSESQIDFLHKINDAGGFACFVRDIDDAIEFFERIDKFEAERNSAQAVPF